MKNPAFIFLLSFLFFGISCQSSKDTEAIESKISEFKENLAPDKRVAIWDISLENGKLIGQTDQLEGLDEMLEEFEEMGLQVENEIQRLPSEELGDQTRALVTISVANIRSQPKHSAELATQALMGTPLKVLEKSENWYRVQTPDQYISWVDAGGIQLMSEEELESWYRSAKVIYTEFSGFLMNTEGKVSDLVAGDILELVGETDESFEVKLPDGRTGQLKKSEALPWEQWLATRDTEAETLITTAKSMMGAPYLWGGTSIKGVDCSGFTKTIFYLNGKIIPRDASQQIHEGDLVDADKNWENLEVGDLLFFGKKATEDSKERVIHVGMWIGNNQFIHSSGRVRISSFDPESPLYDEYELGRYLRTKRIVNTPSENILSVSSLLEL